MQPFLIAVLVAIATIPGGHSVPALARRDRDQIQMSANSTTEVSPAPPAIEVINTTSATVTEIESQDLGSSNELRLPQPTSALVDADTTSANRADSDWSTLPPPDGENRLISIKDVFMPSSDAAGEEMKGISIIQGWLKQQNTTEEEGDAMETTSTAPSGLERDEEIKALDVIDEDLRRLLEISETEKKNRLEKSRLIEEVDEQVQMLEEAQTTEESIVLLEDSKKQRKNGGNSSLLDDGGDWDKETSQLTTNIVLTKDEQYRSETTPGFRYDQTEVDHDGLEGDAEVTQNATEAAIAEITDGRSGEDLGVNDYDDSESVVIEGSVTKEYATDGAIRQATRRAAVTDSADKVFETTTSGTGVTEEIVTADDDLDETPIEGANTPTMSSEMTTSDETAISHMTTGAAKAMDDTIGIINEIIDEVIKGLDDDGADENRLQSEEDGSEDYEERLAVINANERRPNEDHSEGGKDTSGLEDEFGHELNKNEIIREVEAEVLATNKVDADMKDRIERIMRGNSKEERDEDGGDAKQSFAAILSADNSHTLQIAAGGFCLGVVLSVLGVFAYRKLRSKTRIFKVDAEK